MRGLPVVRGVAAASAVVLALAACSAAGTASSLTAARDGSGQRATCTPTALSASAPSTGALLGVSLDWDRDSIAEYTQRLGRAPAVAVTFTRMPLRDQDRTNVAAAADQAAAQGSMLLLTLEPTEGLATVTDEAIDDLVEHLAGRQRQRGAGRGAVRPRDERLLVRLGPAAHGVREDVPPGRGSRARGCARVEHDVGARTMAAATRSSAANTRPGPGSKDARALDTNGDGALDGRDDSYAPYYPGDEAVDWVGMSLYHWGTKLPVGSRTRCPAAGKLVDQLRGRYRHAGVDERVVPDFYAEYGTTHGKPVAITETAALYVPGRRWRQGDGRSSGRGGARPSPPTCSTSCPG